MSVEQNTCLLKTYLQLHVPARIKPSWKLYKNCIQRKCTHVCVNIIKFL